MVSPLTFPVYLIVNLLPMRSRVTWKETSPSLYFPSSMAVSWPSRPGMDPVNLSPSSFSLSVISRSWPPKLTVHFQVPVGFALSSARRAPTDPAKVTTNAAAKNRLMRCLLRKIGVCLRQHLLRELLIRPLEVDAIAGKQ